MSDRKLDRFLKKYAGRKALVAWSGGLDSTYLVWRCLRAGIDVTAAYFEIANNESKVKRERAALDRLEPMLRACASPSQFTVVKKAFSIEVDHCSPATYMQQVPAWLAGLTYVCGGFDVAALSYVMNDDAVSYLDDISSVYAAMKCIMHSPPELEFPLSKTRKQEILFDMPERLVTEVTFCENFGSEGDNCGECTPCRRWKRMEEESEVPHGVRRFDDRRLSSALATAIGALEKIADPIEYFRKEADRNSATLNGLEAVRLAQDAAFHTKSAREALAKIAGVLGSDDGSRMFRDSIDESIDDEQRPGKIDGIEICAKAGDISDIAEAK